MSSADLASIETLYDQGRYVSALAQVVGFRGPLAEWKDDVPALVLGCRLAGNVGGDHLARTLILRAARLLTNCSEAAPDDQARVELFRAYAIVRQRGPFALRRHLRRETLVKRLAACTSDLPRAELLCLRAWVAASYRDADGAEASWQQARELAPADAWIWTERAALLVRADRFTEALEASEEALRLRPWYRPALQGMVPILTLLGRDEEGAGLLERALDPAVGGLQSAALAAQLAEIYREARRPADILRCLDLFEAFAPLMEESGRLWLHSRRCEAHLQLDDLAGAALAAKAASSASEFYAKTAARLAQPENAAARHVLLEVPFVRQHEKTCAPATLAALTRFWGRPAEHADIAREICYGGTFDHEERRWAETHGWVAREFRADWESSLALLDARIPFTLATSWINSGHLQAVIGYDARRGTIVIRDPFERNNNETLAAEFFAQYAFCGPRAMAIVPADDSRAVETLRAASLPEADAYDELYRLRRALHRHDRATAHEAMAVLDGTASEARLTLLGRRELAFYDGNNPAALAAVERLLAAYPKEGRLRLEKLNILRRMARPAEARAWLETCLADRSVAEPHLWRELARELHTDARQRARAGHLLARALFFEGTEAEHLQALAEFRWDDGDHAEAAELLRLAACVGTVQEAYWQHYFIASRHLRQTDEVLALLEKRFQRLGDRSSQPGRTLYWARRQRHDYARASAVLDESLARRSEDGELKVYVAVALAGDGEHARAATLLEAAHGLAAPNSLARAAAELAGLRGDAPTALAHWREVLAREPLDLPAHRAVIRLLAETDARGPSAAREHLDDAVAAYPSSVALHTLRVESLAAEPGRGSPEHLAGADALLAVEPTNLWALREKSLALEEKGDLPSALGVMEEAIHLDPGSGPTHAVHGRLLLRAGHHAAARQSLCRALTLDADIVPALHALLQASPTTADKRESLGFVRAELLRQPLAGEGVLAYQEAAYPILAGEELQAHLDEILAAHPDQWQAWSASIAQNAANARLETARSLAGQAVEKFPLVTGAWMDLARAEGFLDNDGAAIDALERALRIRADLGEASRALAAVHRRRGDFTQARTTLEQAIAAAPLDVLNRGALAQTLWQADHRRHGAEVLDLLTDAVTRKPAYEWAWETLARYAETLGQPERALQIARALTETRPGEARSWMRLAYAVSDDGDACLKALDRTLKLDPRLSDAHDLRARQFARAGRFAEALEACQPPPEIYPDGTRPFVLDGRAAWVLHRRGDHQGARGRLRAIVADHPAYSWAWQMLAEWAEAAGDWPDALHCAERLAILDPHAAPPLGYVADARLRLGQREAAKEALREAMRRDPAYAFAPVTLFRVQMEDKDLAGAEGTLGFLTLHHAGPIAASRRTSLLLALRNLDGAKQAFTTLAGLPSSTALEKGCLAEGVRAMLSAGQGAAAEQILCRALHAAPPASHPDAAALWVRARVESRGMWGIEKKLSKLPEGEMLQRARVELLGFIGEHKRADLLAGMIRRRDRALRADTKCWGQVGYACTACGEYAMAVKWMKDWRDHPDAEGWMLMNLSECFRALGRHREALEINRRALELPPDYTRQTHLGWVALEEVLTCHAAELRQPGMFHLEVLDGPAPDDPTLQYVWVLMRGISALRLAPLEQRGELHREFRKNLRETKRSLKGLKMTAALRRAKRRAMYVSGVSRGTWWAKAIAVVSPWTQRHARRLQAN